MGSGGSALPSSHGKPSGGPRSLKVIDYTNKPLPLRFGRVIIPPHIPSVLPPPPPMAMDAEKEGRYAWFVEDLDRPGEWEAYGTDACERLDAAWRNGKRECLVLTKKRRVCTVNLQTMEQVTSGSNARQRKVKRVEVEECEDSKLQEKRYMNVDPFLEESLDDAAGAQDNEENDMVHGNKLNGNSGIDKDVKTDGRQLPCLLRSVVVHAGTPFTMTFSPDGSNMLTGTRDELIHWDLEKAVILTAFNIQCSNVLAAVYSSDGSRVVCGGSKNIAWLFDTNCAEPLLEFSGHSHKIYGIEFLAGEKHLASVSMDKTLCYWDAEVGACLRSINCHNDYIFTLATSKISDWFAISGGSDNIMCAHDFRIGGDSVTARFSGHKKTIWTCAFRGDEEQFVSSGMDRALNIWDVRRSDAPVLSVFHHLQPVQFVEYMPHGKAILSCARDCTVRLTDASSGDPKWRAKAHVGYAFRVRYHQATQRMATSGRDGYVNLWKYDNVDNL